MDHDNTQDGPKDRGNGARLALAGRSTSAVSTLPSSKRLKTGGRKALSLDEQMARARVAAEIAAWPDDTTLSVNLAALYLGMSTKQLESLRKRTCKSDGSRGVDGPPMIKIFDKGAIGQNQPVNYKLGDLRQFQKDNMSTTSFDSAVNAGLAGRR